jgi:hypothetical protein
MILTLPEAFKLDWVNSAARRPNAPTAPAYEPPPPPPPPPPPQRVLEKEERSSGLCMTA